MQEKSELSDGAVHVWCCHPERVTDPALLSRYVAMLSDEERRRWRRYVFEKDRHRHLVSWALVRWALSHYASIEPVAWRFHRGPWGKPEILEAPDGLRFNLSHTDGLVACAVTRDRAVGIDVERLDRDVAGAEVAERSFAPAELAAWRELSGDAQHERFFTYWTLKEAFIKADGRGIGFGLQRFAFELDGDEQAAVRFDDDVELDASSFAFRRFRSNGFLGAVALAGTSRDQLAVERRDVVPLI